MIALTPLFFTYLAVVTLSVVMAAFVVPQDRPAAVTCAAALLVVWMAHLSSWTPYSPEQMLTGTHDVATRVSSWAIGNTLAALVVLLVARYTLWGVALFALLFTGCANDSILWVHVVINGWQKASEVSDNIWLTFSHIADVLFLGEQAIFFVIGGGACADFVSRNLGTRWRRNRSNLAACRETS